VPHPRNSFEPPQPPTRNIYKTAKKTVWLGTVEASDKAIEKAVQEFKTEAWRLLAVQRR